MDTFWSNVIANPAVSASVILLLDHKMVPKNPLCFRSFVASQMIFPFFFFYVLSHYTLIRIVSGLRESGSYLCRYI